MWEMCLPLLSPRWAPPDLWGHRTQIRAKDEAGITALSDALGSGDALKTKINSALNAQGLDESTGVTTPTKVVINNVSPRDVSPGRESSFRGREPDCRSRRPKLCTSV